MDALKAENVCHGYGEGRAVLKNFNLALESGRFAALMGPSGTGKSTFLHLACGLLLPESGRIEIGGSEITAMSDSAAAVFRRTRIGVVFQSFNLIESLDVGDNIMLPSRLARVKADKARLEELLELLGIAGKRRELPQNLSGGERQRVAIARALYSRPDVVLADEPTGNLDMEASASFCRLLIEINKTEKSAILMVTHDPVVASAAGKVHFLRDGAIRGTVESPAGPAEISNAYLEFCR